MSTILEGLPEGLASADFGAAAVTLSVDATVYPLEALHGASYVFIDRCYVLLDQQGGRFSVTLAPKKAAAADALAAQLRDLAGEFGNELLSCAWRAQITKDNRATIESVTMQAIAGAMGPPSLDDLAAFDFTEQPFEDPLGIAMSWEEKYKKKGKDEKAETPAEAAAPAPAAAAGGAEGA